ncbi:MAG: prevent-host-death protein [Spirochaetaceae bacterium]|jgi:hypothetical protein|nr:prevent-host-death protein [Spirochaetaceae bacterium]
MPNIKPISDLRNYTAVLGDIAVGEPMFLTQNGRNRYVILDMDDYTKTYASVHLMTELFRGRKSGEESGWQTIEDVETALGIR